MLDLTCRLAARSRLLLVGGLCFAFLDPPLAIAKDLRTTVCGRDGCSLAAAPLAGVATTGRAATPRTGRFYTLRLTFGSSTVRGYTLVYERRRQLVKAGDSHARAFLGAGWHVLDASVRVHYANAVVGRSARRSP